MATMEQQQQQREHPTLDHNMMSDVSGIDLIPAPAAEDAMIAAACTLTSDLLLQLTRRDSPPWNETKLVTTAAGAADDIQACHTGQSSPTELAGNSSFGSDGSDMESFFHDLAGKPRRTDHSTLLEEGNDSTVNRSEPAVVTQAYTRIGHAALVNLCHTTLEQVQESPLSLLEQKQPTISSSSAPPPILEMIITSPKTTTHASNAKLKKRSFWKKRRDTGEEKKEDYSSCSAYTSTQPRLVQFACEYARHLSDSQLAPPPCRSKAARMKFKLPKSTKTQKQPRTMTLENANPDILTGAILDICVADKGCMTPPSGFYKLTQTASGRSIPLKFDIYIKKEASWDRAAQRPTITSISLIYPDEQEFVPPGFCVARKEGVPANLGSPGRRCYLVYRRSREGNPLTGLLALMPPESIPAGYTVVERSPRNRIANLLTLAGKPLFLAYRQRLENLEVLRPFPLLRAVQPKAGADFTDDDEHSYTDAKQLRSYYCTGGTTVSSNVGQFHIMDRSTHTLFSPSSVESRLHLLEASSRRSVSESGAADHDFTGNTLFQSPAMHDLESVATSDNNLENIPAVDSFGSDLEQEELRQLSSLVMRATNHLNTLVPGSPALAHNPTTSMCLEAMRFIPLVETNRQEGLFRLQMRLVVLTPILTACYTRHGGAALVSVEGLCKLLTEADFFRDDIVEFGLHNHASSRLTLLDLAVQTVCDVATASAMETTFPACVEFIESAVYLSRASLNTRTIGYIVRFYLFIFYFGASVPSGKSWMWCTQLRQEGRQQKDSLSDVRLLDDPRQDAGRQSYLPGGAPQAAALAFKEMLSFLAIRVAELAVAGQVRARALSDSSRATVDPQETNATSELGAVMTDEASNVFDHVSMANFTELACHQIPRSGGSELFWHDMVNTCGVKLFGADSDAIYHAQDAYKTIFAVLANLVKVATSKNRPRNGKPLLPREIASKMLSFELIHHFLEVWNGRQEAINKSVQQMLEEQGALTLAYTVRRMIVPAMLANTQSALEDPQVFRRIIRILTQLWHSPLYRSQCKVEIGVLIEHFSIKLLQLGPQFLATTDLDLSSEQAHVSLLSQQLDLIAEVKCWFSNDPKDVIEMYLNFDTNLCEEIQSRTQIMRGTQSRVVERLCSGLSNIAERCGEVIGDEIKENQTKILSNTVSSDSALSRTSIPQFLDRSVIRHAARILRKSSLEAISQIVRSLAISAAAGTDTVYCKLLLSWTTLEAPVAFERSTSLASLRRTGDRIDFEQNTTHHRATPALGSPMSMSPFSPPINMRSTSVINDEDVLQYWRNAYTEERNERPAMAKLSNSESTIVALEIAHRKSLKKAIEYLIACGAINPAPRNIADFIRINRESLDPKALGIYLGEGGTGSLETEYWNEIRFVYVSFASFAGMQLVEGLRMFLTDCGFQLPGEAQMIDRMIFTFARCYFKDNATDPRCCPLKHEDAVYLLSFAIIMLNTDLHKVRAKKGDKKMTKAEFANNLRGTECGADIARDYLSDIYDSIETNPLEMLTGRDEQDNSGPSALADMLSSAGNIDSLLRCLSIHHFKFATIDDFDDVLDYSAQNAVGNLARSCVSRTWTEWYGVINTGLETAHLDPTGMEACVEILLHALSSTIILGMPLERAAFLNQLGRLKAFEERRCGRWVSPDDTYKDEEWYLELEDACSGSDERKLWALEKIHRSMVSLKSALLVDVKNKVKMTEVVKEIIDGDFLMQDPARSFIQSEGLLKRSTKTGRVSDAHFFLFSDLLIYAKAHSDDSRQFVICEKLPLHLIKVIDFFPPTLKNRQLLIEIHHPRKSFQILCPSHDARKQWMSAIKSAAKLDLERKMNVEAARMAVYPALH